MSLPRFFARQPVLVNMLMIAILVGGIFAMKKMPLENMPSIDMDAAVVIVNYPGATPAEVEKLITLPIEDQISSLPDIDFIAASSSEGRASFYIQYEPDIEDFDQAYIELKSEVDKVKPDLPEDARDYIWSLKIATDEMWPIVSVAMGGDYSEGGMNDLAESLKEEILKVDDIGSVDIWGIMEREIWVEANRSKLEAKGISLNDLRTAVQMANVSIPAGRVTMGREEFLVRSMGEVNNPEEIGKIVVRTSPDAAMTTIEDIAFVNDRYEEDQIISRLNGKPSVMVRAFMKREGSVVQCVDEIRKITARYQKEIPDVDLTIRHDASKDVKDSLQVLSTNAFTGLVLVALLMTFTIGLRSAVMAIIGIPFAFLTAFIFLFATDGSINTLSLFSFILVLGMVVDDAIIIIENVYRHLEEGKKPLIAAIEGTQEVMWPVISAILTSVAAFLPLLLMSGVMGKFMAVLPIVVSLALVGSLIQSIVVLPSHLADFGKAPHHTEKERIGKRFLNKLLRLYQWQLNAFLNHRYLVTIGIFILTIAMTYFATKVLRVEMFPEEDVSNETMIVRLPTGTKIEETDRVLGIIEKRIMENIEAPDIIAVSALTGLIVENEQWTRSTSGGMITIELGEKEERRTNDKIKGDVRKLVETIPEIQSAYFKKGGEGGPPTGKPVEIRVRGDNLNQLQRLAKMLADDLRSKKGVEDIDVSQREGKKELRFIPDRMKMSAFGVTMASVADTMRTAVNGFEATEFRDDKGEEVKIRVIYREEDRDEIDDLRSIVIASPMGVKVPLSELGEFEIKKAPASIDRRDGRRTITVTANVNNTDINSDEANDYVRKKYADFSTTYPGYSLEFGGMAKEQAESFQSLGYAFIVAIILIYLILGTQFQSFAQPLVVMFTVPFSILGVTVGLILMDMTFSLLAGISVVALSGVVVNDSLVMVDFINRARASGLERRASLIQAGSQRMRPILLTTITTVSGLLPMAIGLGGESQTWQPLAISFCWGISFATFLTLFIIPCSYSILDDWLNFLRRLFKMRSTEDVIREREEMSELLHHTEET